MIISILFVSCDISYVREGIVLITLDFRIMVLYNDILRYNWPSVANDLRVSDFRETSKFCFCGTSFPHSLTINHYIVWDFCRSLTELSELSIYSHI